jgi:hypothetical protein
VTGIPRLPAIGRGVAPHLGDATLVALAASELDFAMDRRAELEGWIANTRRLQRRMAIVFGALAAVAVALAFWSSRAGGFAIFGVALVAICSFWVTAAHNAAHRQKLAELERVEHNGGKPLETGHRRWRSPDPP